MKKVELLSPCGDFERLKIAINYGANAVYFAGKKFGLRAFASNFDEEEIKEAVCFAHSKNVKCFVTINILAHNQDFIGLVDYLKFLDEIKVDGVIVSDLGIASLVKENTNLELHVSTQANITNTYAAKKWVELGAKRLVLARELSLEEIKEIKEAVGENIDLECFIHGAMCISYSGRCLLSNYLTGRDSNKGECSQLCRWDYALGIKNNDELDYYPIEEDQKGTYILNSKDLCLIEHLKELIDVGISSFKIEGRNKSDYYVATVTNAYRRALDDIYLNQNRSFDYIEELKKTSNRSFTTGFYFHSNQKTNILSSRTTQTYKYVAYVLNSDKEGYIKVEHRNKFRKGDKIEILSPFEEFNKNFVIEEILNLKGEKLEEVKKIKEVVYIKCDLTLHEGDMLRMKENCELKN